MSKRRREEEETTVNELIVRPEAVCEALVSVTRAWRDKCNSLYLIESKMVVNRDFIQLKVLELFASLRSAKAHQNLLATRLALWLRSPGAPARTSLRF